MGNQCLKGHHLNMYSDGGRINQFGQQGTFQCNQCKQIIDETQSKQFLYCNECNYDICQSCVQNKNNKLQQNQCKYYNCSRKDIDDKYQENLNQSFQVLEFETIQEAIKKQVKFTYDTSTTNKTILMNTHNKTVRIQNQSSKTILILIPQKDIYQRTMQRQKVMYLKDIQMEQANKKLMFDQLKLTQTIQNAILASARILPHEKFIVNQGRCSIFVDEEKSYLFRNYNFTEGTIITVKQKRGLCCFQITKK